MEMTTASVHTTAGAGELFALARSSAEGLEFSKSSRRGVQESWVPMRGPAGAEGWKTPGSATRLFTSFMPFIPVAASHERKLQLV